jgi:acetolactate synthase-1/3 small subunit
VSLEDEPERIDDFEELLKLYDIVNLQRTGRIALPKLHKGQALRFAQVAAS